MVFSLQVAQLIVERRIQLPQFLFRSAAKGGVIVGERAYWTCCKRKSRYPRDESTKGT